ncbi:MULTISPECIES: hypothetical protein [unclassified Nonomuraea]|uniref:hypothetical protein n=1 Tax=unclassified Nonomuraea TaxID=2593643 RepID=UPI0033D1251E
MAITDLDMWIRKAVREALEKTALGEPYSFTTGPSLAPGTSTPIYLVAVTAPSPILGRTMVAAGVVTIPVDQEELTAMVGELVDQLRQRAAADLKVGFPPCSLGTLGA